MRESRDCQGGAFAGRVEEWLSLRQDQGASVMCRAAEKEKVVLRVHDFRPDVKKRCQGEEGGEVVHYRRIKYTLAFVVTARIVTRVMGVFLGNT